MPTTPTSIEQIINLSDAGCTRKEIIYAMQNVDRIMRLQAAISKAKTEITYIIESPIDASNDGIIRKLYRDVGGY